MTKKNAVHCAVAVAFITASTAANLAFAIDEAEPNNSITSPQALQITSGSVEVSGVIGTFSKTTPAIDDVDFYSFEAGAGSVVNIDIDGGAKSASAPTRSVDTVVAVFDSHLKIIRQVDDLPLTKPIDAGSISRADSYLENVVLPYSGRYIVGVTTFGRKFKDGGALESNVVRTNGSYTMIISGILPAVQQISIQIKPGSGEEAPVNPRSKGSIPVALMSSADFDALKVDHASVTFGVNGDERSLARCNKEGEDINGDGKLDLVCHFDNQAAAFEPGDFEGIVKGRSDKGLFEGRGYVRIVGTKNKQE
jgi:hypothetical protein